MKKHFSSALIVSLFSLPFSAVALAHVDFNESLVAGKGVNATAATSKDDDGKSSTGGTLGVKGQIKGALPGSGKSSEVILDTDLNASVGIGGANNKDSSTTGVKPIAVQGKAEADINLGVKHGAHGTCGPMAGGGLNLTGQYLGSLTTSGTPGAEIDSRLRVNAGLGCTGRVRDNVFMILPEAGVGAKTGLGPHSFVGGRIFLGLNTRLVGTVEVLRKYGPDNKQEDQAKVNASVRLGGYTWLGLDASVTQAKTKGELPSGESAPEKKTTDIYGGIALGVAAF